MRKMSIFTNKKGGITILKIEDKRICFFKLEDAWTCAIKLRETFR